MEAQAEAQAYARVVAPFVGELPSELSVEVGSLLRIVAPAGEGWIVAADGNGRSGLVPAAYLQPDSPSANPFGGGGGGGGYGMMEPPMPTMPPPALLSRQATGFGGVDPMALMQQQQQMQQMQQLQQMQ